MEQLPAYRRLLGTQYDPDSVLELTFHSIQTWALEEARRRLEAEGILPDPDTKKE